MHNAPMALVNILFRPFPWEARNIQLAISSAEIWGFWALAWWRRRQIVASIKNWRVSKLVRVAIPFIIIYSVLLGLLIANMGIIARQRIFLFPFLFLLFEAVPVARVAGPVRRVLKRGMRGRVGPLTPVKG